MTVDITQLTNSFNKIKRVGLLEEAFEVDGMQVTLRTIDAREEHEVEEWAAEVTRAAREEDIQDEDAPTFNLWYDRTRIGALAQSIVKFDGLDLSDTDYIKVGVDDAGKDILKARFVVMRELVSKWSRPLLQLMFVKYGELMAEAQNKLFKAIHIEPSNLESEIDRLHVRLRELEELKRKQDKAASEETESVVRAQKVVEHGQVRTEVHEELAHTSILAQAQGTNSNPKPEETHAQMQNVRRAYMPETAPPPAPVHMDLDPAPAPAPVQPVPPPVVTEPQQVPAGRAPRTLRQAAEVAQGPSPVPETPSTLNGLPVFGGNPTVLDREPSKPSAAIPMDRVPQGTRNPRFRSPQQ